MASLKERSTLTLKDFRGVDYASSPQSAAPFRAVDSRNLILENGALHKRPGWRMIRNYRTNSIVQGANLDKMDIHGIRAWTDGRWSGFIVHIHNMLLFDAVHIPEGVSSSYASYVMDGVRAEPSTMIEYGKKIYILAGDEIYVFPSYDQENGGWPTFKKIHESDNAYVPTTTININAEEEIDENIAVLESPNLLTTWRKNRIVPRNNTCEEHKKYEKVQDEEKNDRYFFSWVLDAPIVENTDVTITYGSYTYISVAAESNYTDRVESGRGVIVRKDLYDEKEYGYAFRGYVRWGTQMNVGTGEPAGSGVQNATLQMWFDECSHDGSEAEVTFKSVEYGLLTRYEKLNRIRKCTVATVFGVNGNTNRLFLSGNPDCPNRIFYSGYDDFTYFGDRNYVTAGTENAGVNGFLRLSDNTMAVLKEPSTQDFSLFYLTGELVNEYDGEGNVESGQAVFYVHNGGKGAGCLNGRSAANLLGDPIMLSAEGVVGITIPSNYTTVEKFVRERSYSISPRTVQNLRTGHGIVYRGRYYLAVDDEEKSCFVADPTYRYYRDAVGGDGSYNYEWQHWNNIPASCFYEWNGRYGENGSYSFEDSDTSLLFGTKDGRICQLSDRDEANKYEDISRERLPEGSMTWKYGGSALIYAEGVDLRFGDRIILHDSELTEKLPDISVTHYGGEWVNGYERPSYFKLDNVEYASELSGGMRVLVEDTDENSDSYGRTFKTVIEEIDRESGEIRVSHQYSASYVIKERYLDEHVFYVGLVDKSENRILINKHSDDENNFSAHNWALDGTAVSVDVIRSVPVCSRWVTPYFDMGSPLYGKTLLGLTLNASVMSRGVHFGYETRYGESAYQSEIGKPEYFSFLPSEFTVEKDFPATHTVRMNVRNFNLIRFIVSSEIASDCSFERLDVLYKINRMNRGVR